MPGQGSIKNFFRPLVDSPNSGSHSGGAKRKSEPEECKSKKSCPGNLENDESVVQIVERCRQFEGALHTNIGPSWFQALESEFEQPYFATLSQFLVQERKSSVKIFPPPEQVWSWTRHFPIEQTKVVILGQDPYHGPSQAHGLCFSVAKGVRIPPSLVNMYKELEDSIEDFKRPSHGFLEGWAKQGVLMLNACLTVRQAQANSHKDKGWERLTDAVVKYISRHCDGVVFLLWGAYAQKKASVVDGKKHHLLKSVHPSPLSAHRGFLGCGHFAKCNKLLQSDGKVPIDWTKLD